MKMANNSHHHCVLSQRIDPLTSYYFLDIAGKKARKTGVIIGATVGAVVGLAGTAVAVPVVVGALGFTSGVA